MKFPLQPIVEGRFVANQIVRHLLDDGPFDMNTIAIKGFSKDDQAQFASLIGYSLGGFGDLSYVSDEYYNFAEAMNSNQYTDIKDARIAALQSVIVEQREVISGIKKLLGLED